MNSTLLRRYGKRFITCISTGMLCLMTTNIVAARPKVSAAPIRIAWSDAKGEIFVYKVRPAQADRVNVQLISDGKIVDTDTKVWAGGIAALLAQTERASKEATERPSKRPGYAAKDRRRLTVTFNKGDAPRSFSVEGEIGELFKFFLNTVDLKALLRLVSGDAPKGYRLIHEGGPLEESMPPPVKS